MYYVHAPRAFTHYIMQICILDAFAILFLSCLEWKWECS